MGLPPSPPCQVLQMPQDEMLEGGYDTDTQLGPFYEDGVSNEVFVSMDENAPEAP